MKRNIFLLSLTLILVMNSCKEELACVDIEASASFSVNGVKFSPTVPAELLSSDKFDWHWLRFRHDLASGDYHIVVINFFGDSVGNYALSVVASDNYGSYIGPTTSGTVLSSSDVNPGSVTILDVDLASRCLSGYYEFTAGAVQIFGQFESLRPTD